MNGDYLSYWALNKPPFSLTPDPDMLYLSGQHSECLMRLKYAIFSHKGGALLVSDTAGNGKTSILSRLSKDLKEYYSGRVKVVFIDHPTLTPIEMIGEIAHQLGAELYTAEKIRILNYLRDRLFALYNENVKVVVIVDEGQMLKDRPDLLGELRILLNFCVSDAFLLTFIFSGQKPLDTVLRDMPEFWQRLPVRFFLKNLDYDDTKALIQFRMGKVGCHEEIFTEEAFEGIYNYSEGCPRIICSVADLCLIIGFAKGARRIGFVEVSTACRDMESSGDGFHYYAYLKSQQYNLFQKPERSSALPKQKGVPVSKPKTTAVSVENEKPVHSLVSPLTDMQSVSCHACAEANPKELKFCKKCGAPLYTKCPVCSLLSDTVTNLCPACKADMEAEKIKLIQRIRDILKKFDILAEGSKIWMEAKGMDLQKDEQIMIIFPRSNVLNDGPVVFSTSNTATSSREACDLILTDRRLILSINKKIISTDLMRVDSCMHIDTGKLIGRRHVLTVAFGGSMYRIFLPYGSRKNKIILDTISSFIQQVMLK